MNTFVLLGLVGLLALFLVRSRRGGRGGGDDTPSSTPSRRGLGRRPPRTAAPDPAPEPSPLAPSPGFPGPALGTFPTAGVAPGPAFTPAGGPASAPPDRPPGWTPAEMIVEPGWPLPGEISGAWSAGPDTAGPPVATIEPLRPAAPVASETAATIAPAGAPAAGDPWEMPTLGPAESAPVADDAASAAWVADAAADPPAPSWPTAPADEPELEIWRPTPEAGAPEAPTVTEPVEAEPPPAELPMWRPDAVAEAGTDEEPAPRVEHEAVDGGDAPPAEPPVAEAALTWMPLADAAAEPAATPEPASAPPAVIAPDTFAETPTFEPFTAVEPSIAPQPYAAPGSATEAMSPPDPVPSPTAPAAPTGDIGAESAEVAALVPAVMSALRPLVRVSDHTGVTPRMLVVMRELAERPLSVGEQAALLGVSCPVIADIAARLENMGLTRRERDELDRRRVRIALTDRGRRVAAETADDPPAEAVATALARMDAAEREGLLNGLRALSRSASTT